MKFFTEEAFLTELNFFKGDTNIYFKQISFFEKKKRFFENHTYFFLKNIIFFNLVLLHLNNHKHAPIRKKYLCANETPFMTK